MSRFSFERSKLRRIGLSLLGDDENTARDKARSLEAPEDQSDPYLSQTASQVASKLMNLPADPQDEY